MWSFAWLAKKGRPYALPLAQPSNHRLQTPNEGINQRNLKNWADVADKICFGHT